MEDEVISTPSYRIFRDKHGIPQFDPKRGTRALKDALVYSFPTLETELQLMQAALQRFFDSEKRGSGNFVCELPENNLQASLVVRKGDEIAPLPTAGAFLKSWKVALAPQRSRGSSRTPSLTSRATSRSRASSRCSTPSLAPEPNFEVGGTMSTWQLCNGEAIEKKKRQPYDPVKRRKVAENRGNACDKHRSQKSTCDPQTCPQNKLYSRISGQQKVPDITDVSQGALMGASEPSIDLMGANFDFSAMEDLPWLAAEDNSSLLDLSSSITTAGSASWTDSPLGSDTSLQSYLSNPIEDTPILSATALLHTIHSSKPTNSNVLVSEQSSTSTTNAAKSSESSLWPNIDESPTGVECGENPFMGWADKRAHQTIEEYGWVLSHVSQL